MTSTPTTDDSAAVTTTTSPTAEGSTSQDTTDGESTAGDAESSEGGDSSSSTGDEVEACAPELGLYANDDCTTLAEGMGSRRSKRGSTACPPAERKRRVNGESWRSGRSR